MNRLLIIVVCMSFFFGCKSKEVSKTIEEDKMVSILIDMQLADEMVQRFREKDRDSVRVQYLVDIGEIYKIDTSVIKENLDLLTDDADLSYEVYNKVYIELDTIYKKLNKDVSDIKTSETLK